MYLFSGCHREPKEITASRLRLDSFKHAPFNYPDPKAVFTSVILPAVLVCLFVIVSQAGGASMPITPDGTTYPRLKLPNPVHGDPLPEGGLRVGPKAKVYFFQQFDPTELNWADNLLRVSIGFEDPWAPGSEYALFPRGFDAYKNKAVVFLSRTLIKFDTSFDDAISPQLRSVNLPDYTITRIGEFLVLSDGTRRRWYFEGSESTERWRLVRIELVQRPGRFVELDYQDGQVAAVRFPNGKAAFFERGTNGYPNLIKTPFGTTIKISRNGAGHVTAIDQYMGDVAASSVPSLSVRIDLDEKNRIIRLVDRLGREWAVEYQSQKSGAGEQTDVATIICRADGSRSAHRYTLANGERDRTIEIVRDKVGGRTNQAAVELNRRSVKVGARYMPVSEFRIDKSATVSFEVDRQGNPANTIDPLGRVTLKAHNELGKPTETTGPAGSKVLSEYTPEGLLSRRIDDAGREEIREYDEYARLIRLVTTDGQVAEYRYSDGGDLIESNLAGEKHKFESDDWGRLTQHLRANGPLTTWSYDPFGRVISFEMRFTRGASTTQPADMSKTFEYDARGLLQRVVDQEGKSDRYFYGKGDVPTTLTRADGSRVVYRYDKRLRLEEKADPSRQIEHFQYSSSGYLETHIINNAKGGEITTRKLDPAGRIVSESGRAGRTQYQYDAAGRRTRIVYPDKSDTVFEYDQLDRVVSIRGSHQPAVDYEYDGKGQRITRQSSPEARP